VAQYARKKYINEVVPFGEIWFKLVLCFLIEVSSRALKEKRQECESMKISKEWLARLAIVIALVFTLSFSIMPVIAGATDDADDAEAADVASDDATLADDKEDVTTAVDAVEENLDAVGEGIEEEGQDIAAISADVEEDAKGFDWDDWWWVLPLIALLALAAWWFLRKKPEPVVVEDVEVEDEVVVEDRFVS
jgi:hypothetical protein